MVNVAPKAVIAITTFRNKAVNVRIPLKVSSKGVQDHDKTGSEVSGLIEIKKHPGNDTGSSMKQTVKKRAVMEKENTQIFINGENTVTVLDVDEFTSHGSSAIHRILIAAGRAEAAVTAEGNKLKLSAVRAAIHGAAVRRITTMDHLVNVSHLSWSGMKSIFDYFIIVRKNFL